MLGLKKYIVLALFGIAVSSVLIAAAQGGGAQGQAPAGQAPAGQRAGGRGQRQDGPPPVTGLTVTGEVQNFVPVTDAMLRNPDPGDWLMIRRDYHASDYSPLNQITRDNVKDLQLVWKSPMNEGGTNQPAPIVHNGVIYLANTGGIMQALDGLTGKVIWENHLGGNIAMRGISIYGNNIYLANGNRVTALDARNGKQLWRFYTIATTGNPGAETWGNLPDRNRAGAEMWITGSYDPVLNLTYWGTAQAKPWMTLTRGTEGDALYSSSTIAVNPDDGKLKWYYQHAPGEALDLDIVFERVLVDVGGQNLLFTIGKDGILWKLDRRTGKYLGHKETVFQNIWTKFDPVTGKPTYREDILKEALGKPVDACPTSAGGKNWPAMSYNAPAGVLIAPLVQACQVMVPQAANLDGNGSGGGASR